jgi:hypothetical protein
MKLSSKDHKAANGLLMMLRGENNEYADSNGLPEKEKNQLIEQAKNLIKRIYICDEGYELLHTPRTCTLHFGGKEITLEALTYEELEEKYGNYPDKPLIESPIKNYGETPRVQAKNAFDLFMNRQYAQLDPDQDLKELDWADDSSEELVSEKIKKGLVVGPLLEFHAELQAKVSPNLKKIFRAAQDSLTFLVWYLETVAENAPHRLNYKVLVAACDLFSYCEGLIQRARFYATRELIRSWASKKSIFSIGKEESDLLLVETFKGIDIKTRQKANKKRVAELLLEGLPGFTPRNHERLIDKLMLALCMQGYDFEDFREARKFDFSKPMLVSD